MIITFSGISSRGISGQSAASAKTATTTRHHQTVRSFEYGNLSKQQLEPWEAHLNLETRRSKNLNHGRRESPVRNFLLRRCHQTHYDSDVWGSCHLTVGIQGYTIQCECHRTSEKWYEWHWHFCGLQTLRLHWVGFMVAGNSCPYGALLSSHTTQTQMDSSEKKGTCNSSRRILHAFQF